tara:strand:+ start:5934 stop:6314 length:381 start_codon:yes stop_codon:yes gene_type:complete
MITLTKDNTDITMPLINKVATKVSKAYTENPESVAESIALATQIMLTMSSMGQLSVLPLVAEINPSIIAETAIAMTVMSHLNETIKDDTNNIDIEIVNNRESQNNSSANNQESSVNDSSSDHDMSD